MYFGDRAEGMRKQERFFHLQAEEVAVIWIRQALAAVGVATGGIVVS
jgi:hypothetical protein